MASKKITAITTTFNGRKLFITEANKRPDGKYVTMQDANPENAMEFENRAVADRIRAEFLNPFGREYTIEQITITKAKPIVADEKFN